MSDESIALLLVLVAIRVGAMALRFLIDLKLIGDNSKGEDLAEFPVDLTFETRQVPHQGAL